MSFALETGAAVGIRRKVPPRLRLPFVHTGTQQIVSAPLVTVRAVPPNEQVGSRTLNRALPIALGDQPALARIPAKRPPTLPTLGMTHV